MFGQNKFDNLEVIIDPEAEIEPDAADIDVFQQNKIKTRVKDPDPFLTKLQNSMSHDSASSRKRNSIRRVSKTQSMFNP